MPATYSQLQAMLAITKASLKAVFRSPSAVIFSIAFPLIFILVFGFVGGGGRVSLNIAFATDTDTTNPVYPALKNIPGIKVVNKPVQQFKEDLLQNYAEMKRFGINQTNATFFLPPYEWYTDSIAEWTKELNLQLINYSPGTRSAADYTWPELKNYQSSEAIYQSIFNYEQSKPAGLNGFLLLLHIGTDPRRKDKFYDRLPQLIQQLKAKGYQFKNVNDLLKK
mgnify:CR=1 FL=1